RFAPNTRIPATPAISQPAPSAATAAPPVPGRHGRAGSSSVLRPRTRASSASRGSSAKPQPSPARYSVLDGNVSVIVPPVPAGTIHPCCQPLTTTGVNRLPSEVRATQPGFTLSGTTSTRSVGAGSARTSRRAGPQTPTGAAVFVAVVS